ncbi:hypothetical protein C8J57DRAFT_1560829 [Mycena rebaudengoi]|nr:hypothetical protein C8J57DRAFT_1560829 [Mycena rebaudengoi]
MSHTCPSFPLELEREIFEIAATHHPETRPTLLLVAHRVLQWIEPLLYRTLVVGRTTLVLGRIAARRLDPANLLHLQPAKWKHVQNLLAWDSHSDLLPVLPLCGHVERLGLYGADPLMFTALEDMPLAVQHLSFINISTLDAIDPSRPLFRTLTHLDMFAGIEGQPLDFEFAQFPALTHLSMHGDQRPPFFLALLASCPRLHVLVSNIRPYWNRQQAHQSINIDMRFVMMFTEINLARNFAFGRVTGHWARRAGKIFGLVPSSLPINGDVEKSNQPHDSGLKNRTRFDELPKSRFQLVDDVELHLLTLSSTERGAAVKAKQTQNAMLGGVAI